MKKLSLIFVTAVFALLFAVGVSAAQLGDVDGNGVLQAADARLALRAAVGLEPAILPETEAFLAADADFSGDLTAADARAILRGAVGLEDLADRLPESAALSEEALREKINAAALTFFVDYEEGRGASGTGFAIDENGTVVVPYSLIRRATAISVEWREDCRVESVLWADADSGLALLKVSGDVPYLPVNRTWYAEGDVVYSTDYMRDLHGLTLIPPPEYPYCFIPEHSICATVPEGESMFDLNFYPMVDRFGRAIGLILQDMPIKERRTAVAAPLSLLPASEKYDPRTIEAYSRDEWRVSLKAPVETVELVQCGTGVIQLCAENRENEPFETIVSQTDLIEASVMFWSKTFPILVIRAKQPCENVPVTVRLDGMYEDAEITLAVSVTEDGDVNLVGMPILPDPGVVWGTQPTDCCTNGETVQLSFMKFNTGLTDEELFYSYTDLLREMGFKHILTEQFAHENRYTFRLNEGYVTIATVEYIDTSASVTIVFGYGK